MWGREAIARYVPDVILLAFAGAFGFGLYSTYTSPNPDAGVLAFLGAFFTLFLLLGMFAHRIENISVPAFGGRVGLDSSRDPDDDYSDPSDVQGEIDEIRTELIGLIRDFDGSGDMIGLQYQDHFYTSVQDVIHECEDVHGINANNAKIANQDVVTEQDVRKVIEQLGKLRGRLGQNDR